jgi:hypothetical protein
MVPTWREIHGQEPTADRPRDQTADAQIASRSHEQKRDAETADDAAEAGDLRAHATTTVHFAA